MNTKFLHKKLSTLRDRIRAEGHVSPEIQAELYDLLEQSVTSPSALQTGIGSIKAANQNVPLNDDQIKRLKIVEKTGTGSSSIH